MRLAQDTIVAAASPPGRSARGLLRISGPETRAILEGLMGRSVGRPPDESQPPPGAAKTLARCRLRMSVCDQGTTGPTLPALAMFLPGPGSYTGQDLAEIQCPGNPALLERLILATRSLGARLALPGEFTFRAFLAGKMDLTQAEGVAATIAATSDSQLQAASLLRSGELGRFASRLVAELARQLALVEAGIDFVDQEDVVPIAPAALNEHLARICTDLADLLGRSRSWSILEALPCAVLVGAPSTGKSTLFNALLGRHRAVTAPMPGTTRDVLAEPVRFRRPGGRTIEAMLMDMAGVDEPQSLFDAEIQAAARRAIESADVILHVRDGKEGEPRGTGREASWPDVPVIRVRNKADLGIRPDEKYDVAVSAATGTGLDALRQELARTLGDRGVSVSAEVLALQPRHEAALRGAAEHLADARGILAPQRERHAIEQVELVAGALRAALDELACLGGQMTPDDIIGRIFATFCIGK